MKTAIFTIAALTTLQSFAGALPDGHYKGNGYAQSTDGQDGSYTAETVIEGNTLKNSYLLPDGSTKEWTFTMKFNKPGFFDLVINGTPVGSGYCLAKAPVCHYEMNVGKLKIEETLSSRDNKIYRLGSKDDGSSVKVWQESLDRK